MGKRYIPMTEWPAERIREELDKDFAHWDDVYQNGCADPAWPDGANLNLIRNHIIYEYKLLHKDANCDFTDECDTLPDERPVPPTVPDNYMAPHQRYPERAERLQREMEET